MLFIFASFLLELFFLPPHCNLKTKSGIKSHGALPDVNHCFCPLLSTMSMKDWLVILLTVNLHKLKIWTSHKEKWPASVSLATFTISLFSSLANFGNYICITTVDKFPVWRILKTFNSLANFKMFDLSIINYLSKILLYHLSWSPSPPCSLPNSPPHTRAFFCSCQLTLVK